jgi:hypothetical protein
MSRIFFFALLPVILLSCRHQVEVPPKGIAVITIVTPSDNQHFVQGDTIHITGRVTNTVAMTEVAVHMTDLSNNNEFFHNHFSAGYQKTFSFSSVYPVDNPIKTSFRVEVEEQDQNGGTSSKDITISIN